MLSAIIVGTVFQSLALNIENKWTDVTKLAIYGDDTALLTCSDRGNVCSFLHEELFFHLHVTLLCPRLVACQLELNLHEIFAGFVELYA